MCVDQSIQMCPRGIECLTTVSGNLRWDACTETLSKKKSSVKKRVSSIKNIKALENI